MKKQLITISLIAILCSCHSTSKMICYTWRVKNIDFAFVGKSIDSTSKSNMIKLLKDSMVVTFYSNHTNLVVGVPEEVEVGTWKTTSNPKILLLKNSHTTSKMTISSLTDTSLVAEIAGMDSTTFFCEMYKAKK